MLIKPEKHFFFQNFSIQSDILFYLIYKITKILIKIYNTLYYYEYNQ